MKEEEEEEEEDEERELAFAFVLDTLAFSAICRALLEAWRRDLGMR
jgi:hypothetical protein